MEVCEERCEVCEIPPWKGCKKWFTIYFFQNTSVVGEKLKELRDSVYHLTVVIVETFTPNDENGSEEVIVKAAKSIERNLKGLFR